MTLGQDEQFSFDTNVYPPSTGTGNTILQDADIVSYKMLQFFRGVLEANLSARWAQECAACGMTNANLQNLLDGHIVGDSICFPVPTTLKQTDYKFPLLSVYRAKEKFVQFTNTHVATEADFIITFTLPPLNSPAQRNHLYPFLSLVNKTLLFYGVRGTDPKYNSGELVWNEAGFAFGLLEGSEYGSFLGQEGKQDFPSVKLNFKIYERDQFVPEDFENLSGFDGYMSLVDGYNINDPVPDFVDFITNPGLIVSSFSPNSGSIQGNTIVTIQGQGFLGANISQQLQISLAGANPAAFFVQSDTVLLVRTGYVSSGASGPVIVTDNLGNTGTSVANFTYF